MVGVLVGVDRRGRSRALLARDLEVHVDVQARIDDDRLAAVAKHIGGAAQISIKNLSKEHRQPSEIFLTCLMRKVPPIAVDFKARAGGGGLSVTLADMSRGVTVAALAAITLSLAGPFTGRAAAAGSTFIRVNQVGYAERARRSAPT